MARKVRKANVLIGRVSRVALDLSLSKGISELEFLRPLRNELSKAVRRDGAAGWKLLIVERDTFETLAGEEYVNADLPGPQPVGSPGQANRPPHVPAQLGS
jgi:hypothetical protein